MCVLPLLKKKIASHDLAEVILLFHLVATLVARMWRPTSRRVFPSEVLSFISLNILISAKREKIPHFCKVFEAMSILNSAMRDVEIPHLCKIETEDRSPENLRRPNICQLRNVVIVKCDIE